MEQAFPLAPMSKDVRVITGTLLPLPFVLGAVACVVPASATRTLAVAAAVTAVLYLAIWLVARPVLFTVSERGVTIRWPLFGRAIAAADIASVAIIDRASFYRDYGKGMRVGTGGLWGTFGLIVTPQASVETFVSRTDRFVLLRRVSGRPLLITPAEPERFVAMVSNTYSLGSR